MPDAEIVAYRGKWCLKCWIDGVRRRLSLGNLDATEENYPSAQRAAADLARDLAKPITPIISEVMAAYLADTKAITKASIENSWKALKPFWGGLRVDQINREKCREYTAQRRKLGRADGTVLKELNALKASVRWSGMQGAVFEVPASPPPRDRWLTEAEFFSLLDAAGQWPHLTLFLHVAIATAARKEAILELTWPQIRWDANQIWLGRKAGGKARAIVPMTATLRAALREAEKVRHEGCEFIIQYKGARVLNIKRAFGSAADRAGLADVTPHDLRHTAAVWMAAAGVSMPKIAQFLGHADSRVTERVYARFSPDHLSDAAQALDLGAAARLVAKKDVPAGSKSGSPLKQG